jgi:hypothetical protein
VLALIAVLGLIPLWHTLYRRYSALPVRPEPGAVLPLPLGIGVETGDRDSDCSQFLPPANPELEDRVFFWYNVRLTEGSASRAEPSASRSGSLGVELTGSGAEL